MKSGTATGVLWTAVGAGTYAICQWGILAVLARKGTLEDVGVLALALAVTAPIFLLFGLNLRVVQATDAASEFSFNDYLALRGLATTVAWLLSCLIAIAWSDLRSYIWVVVGVATAKSAETYFDLVIGRLQLKERFRSIALLQISRGFAALASFGITFLLSEQLPLAVFAWAAVWVVLLAPFVSHAVSERPDLMSKAGGVSRDSLFYRLRKLWVVALPLGGAAVLDSIVLNAPRYVLQVHHSTVAVGIFSALAYLMTIGGVVVGAIGYVATPRMAKLGASKRGPFLRTLLKSLLVAAAVGGSGIAIASTIGGTLLGLIYSPRFAGFGSQLTMIMWAALLWYLAGLTGCALNALRRFGLHLAVHAFAAISVLGLAVALIPSSGVDGAIYATIAAMGLRLVAAIGCLGYVLAEKSTAT